MIVTLGILERIVELVGLFTIVRWTWLASAWVHRRTFRKPRG